MKILATFFDAKGKRLGEHLETHDKNKDEVIVPLIMIRKEHPTCTRVNVDMSDTDKDKEQTNALDSRGIQNEARKEAKRKGGKKRKRDSKRNSARRGR